MKKKKESEKELLGIPIKEWHAASKVLSDCMFGLKECVKEFVKECVKECAEEKNGGNAEEENGGNAEEKNGGNAEEENGGN